MNSAFTFIFVTFFAVALCEFADWRPCENENSDLCTIGEVSITPCKARERAKGYCTLKKGEDAKISFDFTPKFAATTLKTLIYWSKDTGDVAFADMDRDGCKDTTCPTQAGINQQFNYNLRISKKFPNGEFPLKWKVWDDANESNLCCFETTVRLR